VILYLPASSQRENLKEKIIDGYRNFIIKDKEIKMKINDLEKNYLKNLVEILS